MRGVAQPGAARYRTPSGASGASGCNDDSDMHGAVRRSIGFVNSAKLLPSSLNIKHSSSLTNSQAYVHSAPNNNSTAVNHQREGRPAANRHVGAHVAAAAATVFIYRMCVRIEIRVGCTAVYHTSYRLESALASSSGSKLPRLLCLRPAATAERVRQEACHLGLILRVCRAARPRRNRRGYQTIAWTARGGQHIWEKEGSVCV